MLPPVLAMPDLRTDEEREAFPVIVTPNGTRVYRVHCNAGLGDSVVAAYAACGLLDRLDPQDSVRLHTPHRGWLAACLREPRLVPADSDTVGANAYGDYAGEVAAMRSGSCGSRAEWYAGQVGKAYGLPALPPKRPAVVAVEKSESPAAVAFPLCSDGTRDWSMDGWRGLLGCLVAEGVRVSVLCGGDQSQAALRLLGHRLRASVEVVAGKTPEDAVVTIAKAWIAVGVDTGPTHVASLLGVPTVMLGDQFDPRFVLGDWPHVRHCRVPAGGLRDLTAAAVRDAMGWIA